MPFAGERTIRGIYGPLPKRAIRPADLSRSQRAAAFAGLMGRHRFALRRHRQPDPRELEILESCARRARFPMWRPDRFPAGFRMAGAEVVPFSRDVVTMRLKARDGRAFEISQRPRWLPLADELAGSGLPFSRVPGVRFPLFIVHGKYGGEPIDLSFWSTRRALLLERGELLIEIREVVGRGPGLSALVHFSHAVWCG